MDGSNAMIIHRLNGFRQAPNIAGEKRFTFKKGQNTPKELTEQGATLVFLCSPDIHFMTGQAMW